MKDFFKKLNILRKLFISSLTYSRNIEHKKLFLKVVRTYFLQCIILGKDKFPLIFRGKHIQNFSKRVSDWITFIKDFTYRFILLTFVPSNIRKNLTKSFHNYELVNFGVKIPFHPMVTNAPNEAVLEYFLKENGFEITDEFLFSVRTIYNIKKI